MSLSFYLYQICTLFVPQRIKNQNYVSYPFFVAHLGTSRHMVTHVDTLYGEVKMEIKRICKYCNTGFVAQRLKTDYCSEKCAKKAYKARKRKQDIEVNNKEFSQLIIQPIEVIKAKQYLSISEACKLMGVSRSSIYRMIERDELSIAKIGTRTILKRADFDKLFDIPKPIREKKEAKPVTEFYTVEDIYKIYKIKYGRLNTIIKQNNIPKTVHRGKLHISKPHIDRYFKTHRQDVSNIDEWYTVEEIQKKYGLSRDQVYGRISDHNLPKQRIGRYVKISKIHFDELLEFGV